MRKNLPVTNLESHLPDGEFIYSRTDLKGRIVEVNEAFAKISGFSAQEMLGQPHNMIRHPDMPEAAFADLWADLKAGRPWRGVVKNRRKDGGFYWVVANASPVREQGQVVGYQSVRSRPTRAEIEAAEAAYRRINAGDKSLAVEHGRVVRQGRGWLQRFASMPVQLAIVGALALAGALLHLLGVAVSSTAFNTARNVLAIGIAFYAAGFLLVYLPRLNRQLNEFDNWLESTLSTGDMRRRIGCSREDVLGKVIRNANTLVSSLQATMQGMVDSAAHVLAATGEVGNGVSRVAESAHKQSDATSAAAAAVEQVSVSIGEVAEHAAQTHDMADRTGSTSRQGAQRSERACGAITALADTVRASAEKVETLGDRSAEISKIAAVIKEIADQTNLLALNAAIEAARAGEQGRGFAVVADEVRKLAERTSKATQEINATIEAIHAETGTAVEGMRDGAAQVAEGVNLVNAAQESLIQIQTDMDETIRRVGEISHASAEQRNAITQLAQNVEQVACMTEENVAVVDRTNQMVHRLSNIVERMNKAVNQYSI